MNAQPKQDVIDLALKIADSAARSDVEVYCRMVDSNDQAEWYDTESIDFIGDPEDSVFVADSVRYLDLRGLIVRHIDDPTLVSFPRTPETASTT